jgi:drug/metabolite transporter (DMT)-like permease
MPISPMRANVYMHLCVVVWGFTAILGKLISLSALNLVLWRMGLTAIFLALMARAWRAITMLKRADFLHMSIAGVFIALHWVAFYSSVKLANASIGVLCVALAPIFSALLSPLLSDEKFNVSNFLLSLSVLPGMVMVVGGVDARFHLGIAVGALSSLLVAVFSLLNKKLVARFDVLTLSFVEIAAGCLVLLPICLLVQGQLVFPSAHDWPYLLVFAGLCTALPFAVSAAALRQMSAFSAQFVINLEPVYGIVFAALLLHETKQLTPAFYLGAGMIIVAVFTQALLSVRAQKMVPAR